MFDHQLIIYIKKRNDGKRELYLIINCHGKIVTRKQRKVSANKNEGIIRKRNK